jgi:hypothetical protein
MSDGLQTDRLSFRVHFMRIKGPESDPTVRVLLVETIKARTIYEGFGTWLQCRRWVTRISECAILGDQFATVEKRLELNRWAMIEGLWASPYDLESVGFHRADC